jgi:hypothetical protein
VPDATNQREDARYRVTSTSRQSAAVEQQVLSLRREVDGSLTRRVIEPLIVDNPNNPQASLKITFSHQRRRAAGRPWEEEPAFNLATLRAGDQVRLSLSSEETLALFQHLRRLYEVGAHGVMRGEHLITIVDEQEAAILRGSAKEIVEKLIQMNGPDIFSIIDSIEPDLLTAAALARTHAAWRSALTTFEAEIEGTWAEGNWQRFFEDNPWIFGHGLDYRFLVTSQGQPNYGGTDVAGHGGARGDFLMNTEGDARFAVLVEIKKPRTPLLAGREYRNGAWQLGPELSGGVVQLQANCHQWDTEGARLHTNRRWLQEHGIDVTQPKGILLIGHLSQLDTEDKRASFERFRRNLWNPEVLTFDELLARARFLVEQGGPHQAVGSAELSDGWEPDELPF